MKEILFRGKSIDKHRNNGEWVYGGIIHQTDFYGDTVDDYYIMDGTVTIDYDIGDREQVAPETIGQFTGLLDKNGNKIFEGDIVYDYCQEKNLVILWDNETCRFVRSETVNVKDKQWYSITNMSNQDGYKVVGNIFENPELLEVSND